MTIIFLTFLQEFSTSVCVCVCVWVCVCVCVCVSYNNCRVMKAQTFHPTHCSFQRNPYNLHGTSRHRHHHHQQQQQYRSRIRPWYLFHAVLSLPLPRRACYNKFCYSDAYYSACKLRSTCAMITHTGLYVKCSLRLSVTENIMCFCYKNQFMNAVTTTTTTTTTVPYDRFLDFFLSKFSRESDLVLPLAISSIFNSP